MARLTYRDEFGFAYIRGIDAVDLEEKNDEALEKLAFYEDAEEQGKLEIFPFSIGQTVYFIYYNKREMQYRIAHKEVEEILIRSQGYIDYILTDNLTMDGEHIYSTLADAEVKLKELEG